MKKPLNNPKSGSEGGEGVKELSINFLNPYSLSLFREFYGNCLHAATAFTLSRKAIRLARSSICGMGMEGRPADPPRPQRVLPGPKFNTGPKAHCFTT